MMAALTGLPDETIVDGEIVALDAASAQRSTSFRITIQRLLRWLYYLFDAPHLAGQSLIGKPLRERRNLLREKVMACLNEPILLSKSFAARRSGGRCREGAATRGHGRQAPE
jgi:ATP-dependent DNA ligase